MTHIASHIGVTFKCGLCAVQVTSSLDVDEFTTSTRFERNCRLHVVSYRVYYWKNKVWCAFSSRIGSILSTSCWKIKLIQSFSNRKWLSTVVDDV